LHYEGNAVSDNQLRDWGFGERDKVYLGNKEYNVYFNDSERNQAVLSEFSAHQHLADIYNLNETTCSAPELTTLMHSRGFGSELLFLALTEEPARNFMVKNGAAVFSENNPEKCAAVRKHLKENPDVLASVKTAVRRISTYSYNLQMSLLKDFCNEYK